MVNLIRKGRIYNPVHDLDRDLQYSALTFRLKPMNVESVRNVYCFFEWQQSI